MDKLLEVCFHACLPSTQDPLPSDPPSIPVALTQQTPPHKDVSPTAIAHRTDAPPPHRNRISTPRPRCKPSWNPAPVPNGPYDCFPSRAGKITDAFRSGDRKRHSRGIPSRWVAGCRGSRHGPWWGHALLRTLVGEKKSSNSEHTLLENGADVDAMCGRDGILGSYICPAAKTHLLQYNHAVTKAWCAGSNRTGAVRLGGNESSTAAYPGALEWIGWRFP